MTPIEALHRIISEAESYAANRERFQPSDLPALREHHTYREGVRDGKLQMARIAAKALENVENTGDL